VPPETRGIGRKACESATLILYFTLLSLIIITDNLYIQNNIVEFIIRHAPPAESVQRLAIRVMNVNFGSTHTSFVRFLPLPGSQPQLLTPSHSAIVLTQTIFELASLSASDLDAIRAEITHALEVEGGWNKPALARFHKIDSLLREVARVHGLGCGKSATPSGSYLPYQSLT